MNVETTRMTFTLSTESRERLKAAAKQRGIKVSELIRAALATYGVPMDIIEAGGDYSSVKRQYFVLTRTLEQHDYWKPVAGPFETRAAAKAEAAKYEDNGHTHFGQNPKYVVEARVASKTQLKQWGYDLLQVKQDIAAYQDEVAWRESKNKEDATDE